MQTTIFKRENHANYAYFCAIMVENIQQCINAWTYHVNMLNMMQMNCENRKFIKRMNAE